MTAHRRVRLPGKIADRYLFASVLTASWKGMLWFGGILIMFALLSAVRKFIAESLPFTELAIYIALQLPRVFVFTLPMSLLFGTLQTFAELSAHGEITALQVAGVSLSRLLRAPLVLACVLSVASYVMQEYVVPDAEIRQTLLLDRGKSRLLSKQSIIQILDPQPGKGPLKRIVQASGFDPGSQTLENPVVTLFDDRQRVSLQIQAKSGQWNMKMRNWKFVDADTVQIIYGSQGATSVSTHGDEISNEVQSPDELTRAGKEFRARLKHGDFQLYSLPTLQKFRGELIIERQKAPGEDTQFLIDSCTYGIHDKIATPLICLALILIGAPLGVRPQRSSGPIAMGFSLAILLVYYVIWIWCGTVGPAGKINPVLMAYTPLLITLTGGLFLTWRKSR